MAEWPNVPDSKSGVPQGTVGSNPTLSANAFQFNYDSQTKTWFSGLPGLWVQDAACQSGVSPIFDRSKEHLGSSDTGIALTRRLLLDSVKKFKSEGLTPNGVANPPRSWCGPFR